jgi:hypothetical protein
MILVLDHYSSIASTSSWNNATLWKICILFALESIPLPLRFVYTSLPPFHPTTPILSTSTTTTTNAKRNDETNHTPNTKLCILSFHSIHSQPQSLLRSKKSPYVLLAQSIARPPARYASIKEKRIHRKYRN